jgi:hypothetical protein
MYRILAFNDYDWHHTPFKIKDYAIKKFMLNAVAVRLQIIYHCRTGGNVCTDSRFSSCLVSVRRRLQNLDIYLFIGDISVIVV